MTNKLIMLAVFAVAIFVGVPLVLFNYNRLRRA